MNDSQKTATPILGPDTGGGTPANPAALRKFIAVVLVLLLCFSLPVYHVVRFALHSDLYSHILLITFISLYFVWLHRDRLQPAGAPVPPGWAAMLLAAGLGFLIWYGLLVFSPSQPAPEDLLALAMYSLVLLVAGFGCLFLGRQTLRALAFPLGFLVFLAPFPLFLEKGWNAFCRTDPPS